MDENARFGETLYRLPSCMLKALMPADAGPLAETLVTLDPWRTLGYGASQMAGYLVRPDPCLYRFALRRDNQDAGIVCIRRPFLMGVYLDLLAVFPPFQRRGLGSEILAWLEHETFEICGNLWILVSSFNEPARAFYSRAGMAETATLKDLVKPGYDEILLRKSKGQ